MEMIGEWMEANGIDEPVALIHDQGHDDAAARSAFEILTNNASWRYCEQFPSIEPKSSLADLGLQAADRIAYESFKEISHQLLDHPKITRPALAELRKRILHCYSYHLDRGALEEIRKIEDEGGGGDAYKGSI
jgi:hypothetical protein